MVSKGIQSGNIHFMNKMSTLQAWAQKRYLSLFYQQSKVKNCYALAPLISSETCQNHYTLFSLKWHSNLSTLVLIHCGCCHLQHSSLWCLLLFTILIAITMWTCGSNLKNYFIIVIRPNKRFNLKKILKLGLTCHVFLFRDFL